MAELPYMDAMKRLILIAALVCGSAATAQDVVVMRRAIALPRPKTATPAAATRKITCPTTPTTKSSIRNPIGPTGYTLVKYNGNVADGLAQIKAMDGSKKYYLLLKFSADTSYNNIYIGNDPPDYVGNTFSTVAADGYYVCTSA